MRKLLLLLLLAIPAPVFGQGAFVPLQTATKTVAGFLAPAPLATITVCAAGSIGTPCSLALTNAVFFDVALTQPKPNPFQADSSGNYQFAIAPGTYTVTVTGTGVVGYSYQISVAGMSGTIALGLNQVGIGTGSNNIGGSGQFTFNGNTFALSNLIPATGFGTASNSPTAIFCGQAFTNPGSTSDCINVQNVLTGTSSQISTFLLSHPVGSSLFKQITLDSSWNSFNVNASTSNFLNSVLVGSLGGQGSGFDGATSTVTSVANASAGLTVYTNTGGFSPAVFLNGSYVTIGGFVTGANNGHFLVQNNTATTLTVWNAGGVAETHAATVTTDQPYSGKNGIWSLQTPGGPSFTFGIGGSNFFVAHQISVNPNQVNLQIATEGNSVDSGYHRIVNNSLTGPTGDHGYEVGAVTDGTGAAPSFFRAGVFGGVNGVFAAEAGGTVFRVAQVIKATSAAFATATTAGTCVQNTTAVTGATTSMAVSTSPVSTPGVGAVWSAFVSSAGNVTINECAVAVSAGGTIAFNIRVTP